MRFRNFFVCYLLIYLSLHLLDAAFVSQYSESKSLLSSIFNPMSFLLLILCSLMIYFMEKNQRRTADLIRSGWAALMGTPIVLLAMKFVSMLYSIFVLFRTEFGVEITKAPELPGTIYVILMFVLLAALLHSPVASLLKRQYPVD